MEAGPNSMCELQKIWRFVDRRAYAPGRGVIHLDLQKERRPALAALAGNRRTAAPVSLLVPAALLAWLHIGELPLPTCRQAAIKNNI
jgi:hypothetical protein